MNVLRDLRIISNADHHERLVAWFLWPDDPPEIAPRQRVGISDKGRIYFSGRLTGRNENGVIFAALAEDIRFIVADGCAYFPHDWLAKTYPHLGASFGRIAAALLRQFEEETSIKGVES